MEHHYKAWAQFRTCFVFGLATSSYTRQAALPRWRQTPQPSGDTYRAVLRWHNHRNWRRRGRHHRVFLATNAAWRYTCTHATLPGGALLPAGHTPRSCWDYISVSSPHTLISWRLHMRLSSASSNVAALNSVTHSPSSQATTWPWSRATHALNQATNTWLLHTYTCS
jgi:hypothetical protein